MSDTSIRTYQNYHHHSSVSNVITPDSSVFPEEYAQRAKEIGHVILSSVEHGFQGRYIEYYELAKKYDLKYLFGVEAYWVKDRLEKDRTNAHIILLAKNENGRKAINRILSEASISGYYYKPRIDLDLILSLPKDDTWVTSACVGFWKYDDSEDVAIKLFHHFGNNFFLEVQYHNTDSQKFINNKILNIASAHNIQIIFGADSHYIYPDQSTDRNDYLLSKNMEYEDEVGWYMDYCDYDVAVQRFFEQGVLSLEQIEGAIGNTNIFLEVEEYKSEIFEKNIKLPTIYPNKTQEEKDVIFSELVWSQWDAEKSNVPMENWDMYEQEITKEMSVVTDTKMTDYFLLNYEVVKRGKELGGHITPTGRGSMSSYYICKLLGLTTIDRISAPVKLFPERFITRERILEAGSIPDIDMNLSNPDTFAQAQYEIMGDNHSYPMLAYGTLRPKAAFKLYARAKKIDFALANAVSSHIERYEKDYAFLDENEKDTISIEDYIDNKYKDIYADSVKYQGIVSDFKISPCGYLIYGNDIREEIGIVKIKDHICCLIDVLWAENYKFLKNDLLKVSVVALIYGIYERIGIEPHTLPQLIELCNDNKKVWDVYKNGWTMGINQLEQNNSTHKVSKYAPQNISELSAFSASIRPGFKSNYAQFEAREDFKYGIKSLDDLIRTKEFPQSYMLYQESAMQVLAYAGIPVSETYDIIKNIAKKRADKIFKYKEAFVAGMKSKIMTEEGANEDVAIDAANKTWQIIEDSSRYQFCSAHAYATAGDALYGAYLKSHYPLYFYEVFLNILEQDGDKDRFVRAKTEAMEAYKIKFPPFKFVQDNRHIVAYPVTNEIVSSLSSIKGFGTGTGEALYELGKNTYDDFVDFLVDAEEKGALSSKYEQLIRIDYFESFGSNKKLYDFYIEFTSGRNRYSKGHKSKTKRQRRACLKSILMNAPDERFPITYQIMSEQEILGSVTSVFQNIDKRYVYVLDVNDKFSPRLQAYCFANGRQETMKIQKKLFKKTSFSVGDILYCDYFEKRPRVQFADGEYQNVANEYDWWLTSYKKIDYQEFDKIIEKHNTE